MELAARRLAAEPDGPAPAEWRQAWELRSLARARLRIAEGRGTPARTILGALLEDAVGNGRRRFELGLRLLGALAAQAEGDGEAARASLAAALVLGEAQGAIRSFVDEGPALLALLRELPAGSGYATKLLAAFRGGGAVAEPGGQKSPLIEALNVRELQILRLVEQGMVNKDISSALSIGLDTVKWHLKNAYKKLGVATRTGAIHAARAAGVLGTAPRLKAPARLKSNT